MTDRTATPVVVRASPKHLKFKADCMQAVQALAAHLSVDPVALAEKLEKGGLVGLFDELEDTVDVVARCTDDDAQLTTEICQRSDFTTARAILTNLRGDDG